MKIQTFFLVLPCVAAFFWLLAYLLFASRGAVFRKMTHFLLILSLFLLFSILSQNENSHMLMHFTLFKQICALLLIPYFMNYMYALQGVASSSVVYKILMILPYVQLIVGIESVYSVGYENAVRILIDSYTFQGPMFPYLPENSQIIFYACYTYVFRTILLADFLFFSVNLMKCAIGGNCRFANVLSFFFRKSKAPVKPIQFFLSLLLFLILVTALILGKSSYIENVPLVAIGSFMIAFFLSLIAFVGTAGAVEGQSIPGILGMVRFGGNAVAAYSEDDTDNSVKEAETVAEYDTVSQCKGAEFIDKQQFAIPSDEEGKNRLINELDSKFQAVVEGEELFLRHDLSLTFVADRLGVFKNELSDYVDYKYGMSFQNYINRLRISYAEKYILSHDDLRQKDIAIACGFSGASSFNSAFSKQNGVTPKIWKDRYRESLKNRQA
ncbi:MAG: AraC family transcriptional regulator [Bacteroidaceae bacterium]|nr:AraC family transcriptional regulator [Bacteroidaceae bacterium]